MTQKPDHIANLLDQAPGVPASPDLSRQILTSALLDFAPGAPSSPELTKDIIVAARQPAGDIINLVPKSARSLLHPTALAGGLIAASLMLGIWTGTSGIADNLLAAPFELAGLQVNESDNEFSFYNVIGSLTPPENL